MRYISTFSGIEAASCAWEGLGWEPLAFAEIDPFACAVLEARYPEVPNLGDMTKIDWRAYHGKADLVVGGSPCQSFSIAGKREGLEGESGLMWEYYRCISAVRPRWIVWENVPGALSSSNGEDFRCLLEGLDALGYGLAWRVLDAQFFGVAQRRRRVFLVGCLGDPEGPCEVLFEPESLRWDTPSSADKRKELAARVRERAGSYCIQGSMIGRSEKNGPQGDGINNVSFTLNTVDQHAVAHTLKVRCGCEGGGKGALVQEDVSGTLSCRNEQTLFAPLAFAANQRGEVRLQGGDGDVFGALPCAWSGKQAQGVVCADGKYTVRRLTPTECERLQGFPDGWTAIPWRGRTADDCPDTPRYRALGNSMCVNVMRWIGERIDAVEKGWSNL